MKLKLYASLIILVLLISLSTTYATDMNENMDNLKTTIDNTLEDIQSYIGLTDENEPKDKYEIITIEVSGYEELKNAIVDNSHTWENKSYIINLNDGDYNITDTFRCGDPHTDSQFTINGNGHVLDGQNKYQFIELYANLKLNDLTIQNTVPGKSNSSGAITMESVSNLYVNNCKFINNKGKNKGSSITNRGTAYITNSFFINNSVEENGGSIWSTGEYGGSININKCTFEENTANINQNNDRTSIVYLVSHGNNIIKNNKFIRNNGRCIHSYNKTNTTIIDNLFLENSMKEDGVIRGGIIDNYEADMIIRNNEFNNDSTIGELRGGILYHEVGNLEFSDNKISNYNINYDPTSSSSCSKGGVIFNRNATMNIKNNEFNNVLVGNYSRGGVIYNNIGEITITDNKFSNTVEGEYISGLTVFNDVNSHLYVGNNSFESKNIGNFEIKNEDNYIFNSKVPNEEGSGTTGITSYIS